MSDMVQQPVIQLVQELTMTAVVEQHDCTDTKKEEKSRSPRPCLNTNNSFIIPLFLKVSLGLSHISGHGSVKSCRTTSQLLVVIPKLNSSDRGTKEVLPLNFAGKHHPSR